ncbi:hypothetical protein OG235_28140 [Streptomyces sp. NBC_00024]|uniref:hypothetical protein n=1 Tax=Streptomyces sp. NBC_00024 TaxID=2903612 RepID=UPI00324564C3
MPPNPVHPGSVRSAAAVNAEIRALWRDPSVRLTKEQRAAYERLCVEWAAAKRAEVVEAA